MVKCPNCGSTAQVRIFNKENIYYKDLKTHTYLEHCKCRCGCTFDIKEHYKQVKQEVIIVCKP